jgi:hypothetical protein
MKNAGQTPPFAWLSLFSIVITVTLATVTHSADFGFPSIIAGSAIALLLTVLNIQYQRTLSRALLVVYLLFNAWIIIGFGVINGFWNHAFKVFLIYLHGGYLPPLLAGLFKDTGLGSFFMESLATLTFVASIVASYFCYKLIARIPDNTSQMT